MSKADLIRNVASETGITLASATKAVEVFTSSIVEALKAGESVNLQGFGTFKAVNKEERVGRNPQTGDPLTIPAKTVAKFKASPALNDTLN